MTSKKIAQDPREDNFLATTCRVDVTVKQCIYRHFERSREYPCGKNIECKLQNK